MSVNPEDWFLTSSSKFLPHLFEKRFKNWVVIDRRRGFSQEIKNFTVGQKPQNAIKKTTRVAEIRDVLQRNWTNGSFDKTKEPAPDLDKFFFSIALWPVRLVLMGHTWWEKTWFVIYRQTSSAENRCVWLVKVGSVRGRLMLAQTVLLYRNWLHIYIYLSAYFMPFLYFRQRSILSSLKFFLSICKRQLAGLRNRVLFW